MPERADPRAHPRVDAVDRAWWRMDDPTNHMVVTGLLIFEGELEGARVRALVRDRIGWITRLRTRVEAGPLGLWHRWREHPVDLDAQVIERELPAPGDEASLHALVGEAMSSALDPARPPWEIQIVHGLRGEHGPRSALLTRVHHALGDGIAQMLILLSLTDLEPESEHGNPLRALFTPGSSGVDEARRFVRSIMPLGMKLLLRGDHLALEGRRHAHDPRWHVARASGAARSLASLVLRRPDASTVLRGPLGERKRAAWSRAIPLAELQASAHEYGVTINDLLLAALTGGLRRYLIERGESPGGVELRAAVPINLRGLADMARLGNHFGLLFLSLPVHLVDPRARLAELRRRMQALEHSAEPLVTWAILDAIGWSPKRIEAWVMAYFAARVSLVMTNVPGPERTLWLAGRELRGLMFWVPQSGRVGLGVSICSYAGEVRVGVAADAGLIPAPERLVAGFHAELDALAVSPR
ncbi:wax ester/triacylglycerol synthase family O-acyltransferase [Nannocystaceae bacterium ST9]